MEAFTAEEMQTLMEKGYEYVTGYIHTEDPQVRKKALTLYLAIFLAGACAAGSILTEDGHGKA